MGKYFYDMGTPEVLQSTSMTSVLRYAIFFSILAICFFLSFLSLGIYFDLLASSNRCSVKADLFLSPACYSDSHLSHKQHKFIISKIMFIIST